MSRTLFWDTVHNSQKNVYNAIQAYFYKTKSRMYEKLSAGPDTLPLHSLFPPLSSSFLPLSLEIGPPYSNTVTICQCTVYLVVSQLRATLDISEGTDPCPAKELFVRAVIKTHTQLQLCYLCIYVLKTHTTNYHSHEINQLIYSS